MLRYSPLEILAEPGREDQTKNLIPTSLEASTRFFPCSISPFTLLGYIVGSTKLVIYIKTQSLSVGRRITRKKRAWRTPKTPSQPVIAFLIDSLSHISACATSTPLSLSAIAFSEAGLRVIARGVNVPSDRSASMTADPVVAQTWDSSQDGRQWDGKTLCTRSTKHCDDWKRHWEIDGWMVSPLSF